MPSRQDKPLNDGLRIVDRGKAGGGWASDADFQASVKKNFDFTGADGLKQAKEKAVRENLPLVVVVTSQNTKDGKQLVDNVVPSAKNGDRKAIYVQVKKEDLAADPELAKAAGQIQTNDTAFTGIFAPKQTPDGKIQLGDVMCNTWGARADIPSILRDQLGSAQFTMDSRKALNVQDNKLDPQKKDDQAKPKTPSLDNPFGPRQPDTEKDTKKENEPAKDVVEQRKREDAAEAKVTPLVKNLIDVMKELKSNPTDARREELFVAAEKAADEIAKDPEALKLFQDKAKRELQEKIAKGEKGPDAEQQVKDLQARVTLLDLASTANSWTRLQHGLSLMQANKNDEGIAKIKEGADKNKAANPLKDPQFVKALLETPLAKQNLEELKKKLPEVKFDEKKEPTDKKEDPEAQKREQELFARLSTAPKKIMEPLAGLTQTSNPAEIDAAYKKAIDLAADKALKQDIKAANEILEARKKQALARANGGTPDEATRTELEQIEKDMQTIKKIDQLDGYLSISKGAFHLKNNKDNPNPGVEDVRRGLEMQPELAGNEAVIAKLKDTGYDTAKLKEWFPKLGVTDGGKTETDKEDGKAKAKDFDSVMERLAERHKSNLAPFQKLGQSPDKAAVLAAFDEAIASAHQLDPADPKLADKMLKERQAEVRNAKGPSLSDTEQGQIDKFEREIKSVKNIEQAEAMLRISKGVFELNSDKGAPASGIADIKEGFKLQPDLAKDKDVRDKLLATGVDPKLLREQLPELGPDFGVKPGETKKPDKVHFEGTEFDKASDAALDSKRKMVLKFGTKGCSGCNWMTENAWPDASVQKTLDDNYIFVNIDGLKQKEIREQFQANVWPAVLVVEPYKDAQNKTQYRVVDTMKIEGKDDYSDMNAQALNKFLTDALKKKEEAKR